MGSKGCHDGTKHSNIKNNDQLAVPFVNTEDFKKPKKGVDVLAPIILVSKENGIKERVLGIVDTGSQVSTVSASFLNRIGAVAATDAHERVQLGGAWLAAKAEASGSIELGVLCGGRRVLWKFAVIDDAADEVLLGTDLLPQLGISVTNIPYTWPDCTVTEDKRREAVAAEDELLDAKAPWLVKDKIDESEAKELTRAIKGLLEENEKISMSEPACQTIEESIMRLPLTASKSYRKQYPIPLAAMVEVRKIINKWREREHIVPASPSMFNTPLLVAAKKDANGLKTLYRVCMDLRSINSLLKTTGMTGVNVLPTAEEIFHKVSGFKYASTLDLTMGYQQMPVAEGDSEKLTFTFEGKRYRWVRWPYGLTPSTNQFQRCMEKVLDGCEDFTCIFVDDVIIYSNTLEEHILHVTETLRRFNRHGLKLNIDKCNFGFHRVLLLGHVISGAGRNVDPCKAKQLLEWQEITTSRQVMIFCGFVNFIREYVPISSEVLSVLEPLKRQKGRFKLTKVQQNAVDTMVAMVNSDTVLSNYDPKLPLNLATDGSQMGLGAVLYQEVQGKAGKVQRKFIAFVSKALVGAQKNYMATKRELLAILFAFRKLHHYLVGRRFTLYTDHSALTSIATKERLTPAVADWLAVLLEYDFDIKHRPGVEMVLPDALSRMCKDMRELRKQEEAGQPVHQIRRTRLFERPELLLSAMLNEERDSKESEPTLAKVRRFILEDFTTFPEKELSLFIRERLDKEALPKEDRAEALAKAHAQGHFGGEHAFKRMWSDGYFWPGMKRQCQELSKDCEACLTHNVGRKGFTPARSVAADGPWDHIAVDLATELPTSKEGYKHILVMVDVLTRFVVTEPLKERDMTAVAEKLFETFTRFGPVKVWQSDNGPEFANKLMAELTKVAAADHRLVAPYNPMANGLAERMVQTVKQTLKKRLGGQYERWEKVLRTVTLDINSKENKLIGGTPFALFFTRAPGRFDTAGETKLHDNWAAAREKRRAEQKAAMELVQPAIVKKKAVLQKKQNVRLDGKRVIREKRLKVGTKVCCENNDRKSGQEARWLTGYTVFKVTPNGCYQVKGPDGTKYDRKYAMHQLKLVGQGRPRDAVGNVADEAEHFLIEKIVCDREVNGRIQYLVKWKGYSEDENTWQNPESFVDKAILIDYQRASKTRAKKPRRYAGKRKSVVRDDKGKPKKKRRK
jgi:transposase InsO family protein